MNEALCLCYESNVHVSREGFTYVCASTLYLQTSVACMCMLLSNSFQNTPGCEHVIPQDQSLPEVCQV